MEAGRARQREVGRTQRLDQRASYIMSVGGELCRLETSGIRIVAQAS